MISRLPLTIMVPGTPVAKGRPRLGRGRTYTPAKTKAAEELLGWAAREACPEPIEGPIFLTVQFTFEPPLLWGRKRKSLIYGQPYSKRPDIDNLLKWVLDGANGIVWLNDSQVYSVNAEKVYGPEAMTVVEVRALSVGG